MFDNSDDNMFFGLDVASASDNPWAIDDGWYDLTITRDEREYNEADEKWYWHLHFTIDVGQKNAGKEVKERYWIPAREDDSEDAQNAKSYIKMRLTALGWTPERMNQYKPGASLGTEVSAAVVTNKAGFNQFSRKKGEFKLKSAAAPQPVASGLDMFAPKP